MSDKDHWAVIDPNDAQRPLSDADALFAALGRLESMTENADNYSNVRITIEADYEPDI